jgi:hypothetical protein
MFAGMLCLAACGNDVLVASPAGGGGTKKGEPDGTSFRPGPREPCGGDETWREVPDPVQDFVLAGWTGEELILWSLGNYAGHRFHSASETWRKMAPTPPVLGRQVEHYGAVSSGRFFVWDQAGGAAYDPGADTWTPIAPMGGPLLNDPVPRPVVGTPTHLIYIDSPYLQSPGQPVRWSTTVTGKIYDVARDSWKPLPEKGAPRAAVDPVVVWADHELIVWGGGTETQVTNGGARLNLATGVWTAMTQVDAPTPRRGGAAVWTGKKLFVWGGWDERFVADGGLYDPVLDEWSALPPDGPSASSAVWTGEVVIVTGQESAIYEPSSNTWQPMMQSPTKGWMVVQWDGCRLLAYRPGGFYIYQPPPDG